MHGSQCQDHSRYVQSLLITRVKTPSVNFPALHATEEAGRISGKLAAQTPFQMQALVQPSSEM